MTAKYKRLAEDLKKQIKYKHFSAGEKLPGLRVFSEQKAISISTALATYRLLEADGFLEARDRTGYFVKPLHESTKSRPLQSITCAAVTHHDIIMNTMRPKYESSIVNFSSAVPAEMHQVTETIRKSIVQVAKKHKLYHRYEASTGSFELRMQIARRMAEAGYISKADNVLVTNGGQEALMIALRAITTPGQLVAVESPTSIGLLQVIKSLGLETIEIPTLPEKGISLETLAFALDNWEIKVCIVSPNVNNPLGCVMSEDKKNKLVALAAKKNVTLIEDDVCGELIYAPKRQSCLLSLAPDADIIYCSSFSKSIAPDFRVGWIIGPRYKMLFEIQKFSLNIASSSLLQSTIADIIATGGYDRHLRRARKHYARARDRMQSHLKRYFPSSTILSNPMGGFVYWVTLPEFFDTSILAQSALAKGIAIAPGEYFSASGKYKNALRLNYSGDWSEKTELALKTLGSLINRQIDTVMAKDGEDFNIVSLDISKKKFLQDER